MSEPEDEFQALFDEVPPRQAGPAEAREQAYKALHAQWLTQVNERRVQARKYWFGGAGIAASLVLLSALLLVPRLQSQVNIDLLAGDGVYVQGKYYALSDAGTANPTRVAVQVGDKVRSDEAVSMNVGQLNIRLAPNSELRWLKQGRVSLQRGEIYVDTRELGDLHILTPFGEVMDVGTRYLVALSARGMEVSVRSGEVIVRNENSEHRAKARPGRTAVVAVDRNSLEQHYEKNSDARWNWVNAARHSYTQTMVRDLLTAISQDLGKELQFGDFAVQAALAATTLAGNLPTGKPREALRIVLQTSGLRMEETDTSIIVSLD